VAYLDDEKRKRRQALLEERRATAGEARPTRSAHRQQLIDQRLGKEPTPERFIKQQAESAAKNQETHGFKGRVKAEWEGLEELYKTVTFQDPPRAEREKAEKTGEGPPSAAKELANSFRALKARSAEGVGFGIPSAIVKRATGKGFAERIATEQELDVGLNDTPGELDMADLLQFGQSIPAEAANLYLGGAAVRPLQGVAKATKLAPVARAIGKTAEKGGVAGKFLQQFAGKTPNLAGQPLLKERGAEILGRLAQSSGLGGVWVGATEGAESYGRGDTSLEVLENTAKGVGVGAATFPLLEAGLTAAVGGIKGRFAQRKAKQAMGKKIKESVGGGAAQPPKNGDADRALRKAFKRRSVNPEGVEAARFSSFNETFSTNKKMYADEYGLSWDLMEVHIEGMLAAGKSPKEIAASLIRTQSRKGIYPSTRAAEQVSLYIEMKQAGFDASVASGAAVRPAASKKLTPLSERAAQLEAFPEESRLNTLNNEGYKVGQTSEELAAKVAEDKAAGEAGQVFEGRHYPEEPVYGPKDVHPTNQAEFEFMNEAKTKSLYKGQETADIVKATEEAINKQLSDLAVEDMTAGQWKHKIEGEFGKAAGEDVTAMIEKTSNRQTGEAYEVVKKRMNTPANKRAVAETAEFKDEMIAVMRDSKYLKTPQLIENHMFHRWKVSKSELAQRMRAAKSFVKGEPPMNAEWEQWYAQMKKVGLDSKVLENPVVSRKAWNTFEQGIMHGAEPLTSNAFELVPSYRRLIIRTKAVNELVDSLAKLEDVAGMPIIERPVSFRKSKTGDLLPVTTEELADAGYVSLDMGPAGTKLVHPDAAPHLKVIFSKPFDNVVFNAIQGLNAIAKKTALSFSLFHPMTLVESAIGLHGPVKGPKMVFNAMRDLLRQRGLSVLDNPENVALFARHPRLKLSEPVEASRNIVQSILESAEAKLGRIPKVGKGVKLPVEYLRKYNEVFDEFLWDYLHKGLKAESFLKVYADGLAKNPALNTQEWGDEVAGLINDAFGGQNWAKMGIDPRTIAVWNQIMLAPDWSLSVARQMLSPARGLIPQKFIPQGTGKKFEKLPSRFTRGFIELMDLGAGKTESKRMTQSLAREVGSAYIATTLAVGFGAIQALNYSFSGHSTWDNDPGHFWSIELPWRDKEGRKLYMKLGKQFREILRWATDFNEISGSKLSPAIQAAIEQWSGSSVHGFPLPFKDKEGLEGQVERAKAVGKKFVPFSFQGSSAFFAWPQSRGLTDWKAKEFLKDALRDGDVKTRRLIMKRARENNLDPLKALRRARSELKREGKKKKKRRSKGNSFIETLNRGAGQ